MGERDEKKAPMSSTSSADLERRFLDLIAGLPFRFASAMPDQPHEYIHLSKVPEDRIGHFHKATALIIEHGYEEYYRGFPYDRFNAGEHKYWTMNRYDEYQFTHNNVPRHPPNIINRCLLLDPKKAH